MKFLNNKNLAHGFLALCIGSLFVVLLWFVGQKIITSFWGLDIMLQDWIFSLHFFIFACSSVIFIFLKIACKPTKNPFRFALKIILSILLCISLLCVCNQVTIIKNFVYGRRVYSHGTIYIKSYFTWDPADQYYSYQRNNFFFITNGHVDPWWNF